MKKILTLLWLLLPLFVLAQPKIQLQNFASGFNLPLEITHCGDSRLFVVERDGVIWVLDSLGNRLDTFLNINPRVNSTQNEQGLLGLAFDPNYAQNGYFYVDYTKNGAGDTRVARFSVKPGNPNEADPNSEFTIIEQAQPYWNHNGGCLRFGADGFLYISLGDGGSGGDPQGNGQNKQTFLGKILRIDVRNSNVASPYKVPTDNPFVGNTEYKPEIWSLGWRNPWRFSFDDLTGDMWIADVGQNLWEEIDFEPAHTPGLNYGWRCYEGTHTFNTNACQPASNYVSPVFDYAHSGPNGCSVTGGFIYRGQKYPDLYGYYLFADYCSGRWWYTKQNADGSFTTNILANLGAYEFSTFGVDRDGELYVALLSSGKVQKITELCSAFQLELASFQGTSCQDAFSGLIELSPTGSTGAVTYTWSNGQTGPIIVYLNPGIYSVEAKDGNNCIRRDTFEIEKIGPERPVLSTSDTLICVGGSVQLLATNLPATGSLTWFNGATIIANTLINDAPATLEVNAPGMYSVVLDDTLCLASSGLVVITETGPANPTLTAADQILCPGASTYLIAGNFPPNSTLNWYKDTVLVATTSGANAADTLQVSEAGQYTVSIVDPHCQPVSQAVQIQLETPVVLTIESDYDSLYATGHFVDVQWYLGEQPILFATGIWYHAIEEGVYTLRHVSANGCIYISNEIYFLEGATKLPEGLRHFSISPNPTENKILVEIEAETSEKFVLFLSDNSQRQVFRETIEGQKSVLPIDMRQLPSGTYFLTVQSASGSFVRKVVKK